MSLSAREERALHAIEDEFAGSDPELTFLLATFTGLTSGEDMPVREKIQRGRRGVLRRAHFLRRRLRRDGLFPRARRICQRLGWQGAIVLLLFMAAVGVFVVGLTVGRGRPGARPEGATPRTVLTHLSGAPSSGDFLPHCSRARSCWAAARRPADAARWRGLGTCAPSLVAGNDATPMSMPNVPAGSSGSVDASSQDTMCTSGPPPAWR